MLDWFFESSAVQQTWGIITLIGIYVSVHLASKNNKWFVPFTAIFSVIMAIAGIVIRINTL
ncbi:hypothetical protein CO726_24725 [Bacillus fungorum]|uniref:Uncharacterized protein n=1 Tax=Bacillus fungorum TaxID=2039284 RepID=A0A2G6Q7G1_9BACI|nr:hypothetical protein [Bacillus fungorum]PIE92774.1 hypothetical protein CO726_24725 [Bacillus fungorum]